MAEFGNGGFNAEAPENNVSNIIPAGEYEAVIVKSEKTDCKPPKVGAYLKLDFQIVSGEQQNKHVFQNLNLWLPETSDKSKLAVQISKGHLSAICRAVGVLNPQRSEELHNKPLRIKVSVKEATGEYGPQNTITSFKPRGFSAPAPEMAASAPVAAGAAASANPWG